MYTINKHIYSARYSFSTIARDDGEWWGKINKKIDRNQEWGSKTWNLWQQTDGKLDEQYIIYSKQTEYKRLFREGRRKYNQKKGKTSPM